jgi:hypothetical protein
MADFFDKYFTKYSETHNITIPEKNKMIKRLRAYLNSTSPKYRFAYQGDYWFEFPEDVSESILRENYMLNELAINLDGEWVHLPSVLRECHCTICNHQSMYECYKSREGGPGTVEGHVNQSGCTCCSNTNDWITPPSDIDQEPKRGYTDAPCR